MLRQVEAVSAARADRLLASLSEAEQAELLAQAGTVRVAIVMQKLGMTPEQAQEQLDMAQGRLRSALGEG